MHECTQPDDSPPEEENDEKRRGEQATDTRAARCTENGIRQETMQLERSGGEDVDGVLGPGHHPRKLNR
jgi:hypothetical protein